MATTYEIEIEAQPGIYEPRTRSLRVCFVEPEAGVDKKTGLLLIIAGYGDCTTSEAYARLRETLVDAYNLVTVQCDYFGFEYMQDTIPTEITDEMLKNTLTQAELELLTRDYEKYAHILQGKVFEQTVELDETKAYFNDMGLMQAMDNLRAVKVVLDILKENRYTIDENRIYAYGICHGAYLAYLCNAFWRGGFAGIIDNSAGLVPAYLKEERRITTVEEGLEVRKHIRFRAEELIEDEDILSLPFLYEAFENRARILSIIGEKDEMTTPDAKKEFLNCVEHTKTETITKYRVDRGIFFDTCHGVGADPEKLFRYAYHTFLLPQEQVKGRKAEKHVITYENVRYETEKFSYEVRWENGIPVLYREPK